HNSYEDNGIKVFSPSGRKLDDEAERSIERSLSGEWGAEGGESGMGKVTSSSPIPHPPLPAPHSDASLREKYLAFLRDEVGAGLSLKGLRVAIDCANGAAYELAPKLFSALGADLVVINADPNGRNINLD